MQLSNNELLVKLVEISEGYAYCDDAAESVRLLVEREKVLLELLKRLAQLEEMKRLSAGIQIAHDLLSDAHRKCYASDAVKSYIKSALDALDVTRLR